MAEASALEAEAAPIVPGETVMIGDSDVDVLTARNCGAWSIGCAYGLAPHGLAAAGPDALANYAGGMAGAVAGAGGCCDGGLRTESHN